MIIRKAFPKDSEALIALTSSTPMQGRISLRIDRKPDFFRLLKKRGDHIVIVAEDEQKRIAGSFSAARQSFVINNSIQPVYYLGDLKVHPSNVSSTVAYRLIKAMHEEVRGTGVDLFLCTAAEGNAPVFSFFKGRVGLPSFQKTCIFNVYQLLPKRSLLHENILPGKDSAGLPAFYNTYFKRYHFYPVINNLDSCINLSFVENGKITAALSLYDPASLKRNVIIDYPLSLGIALGVLRILKFFVSLPGLPGKGDELRLLYVRYFGFEEGHEKDFLHLMKAARNFAFENKFHFLTMAADEKDELVNGMIKPLSRFNFRSHQLISSLENNNVLIDAISKNIAYEDYSLV